MFFVFFHKLNNIFNNISIFDGITLHTNLLLLKFNYNHLIIIIIII